MNTIETVYERSQRLVRSEVLVCVSALVSTLAQSDYPDSEDAGGLIDQAQELSYSIADYEEAAIQAAWCHGGDNDGFWYDAKHWESWKAAASWASEDDNPPIYGTAQEVCEANGLEPYQREVFEHWAVSDWLGEKLQAKGERVDTDFAGLTVWARTTTGQMIHADAVIEAIAKDCLQPVEA